MQSSASTNTGKGKRNEHHTHTRADILRAIADGKIIEHRYKRVGWVSLSPSNAIRHVLAGGSELRIKPETIKPETININGHEVDPPVREPLNVELHQERQMTAISKTSVEILKVIKEHPGITVNELGALMGERPPLQYVSGLTKDGLLCVSGMADKPMNNGVLRRMNLYTLTHHGDGVLQRTLERDSVRKERTYTELPVVQQDIRPPMELRKPKIECSVATGREAKRTYEKYVAPPPTGRGYVPRLIRNVANM